MWGAAILAGGGVVAAVTISTPCGCFGNWVAGRSGHLALSGVLGMAATLDLIMGKRGASSATSPEAS